MSDLFKCRVWVLRDGVSLPMDSHMSLKLIVWYTFMDRELYTFIGDGVDDLDCDVFWCLVKRHYGKGFYRF